MLEFCNVFKTRKGTKLHDLSLHLEQGQRLSLECDHAASDLLVDLILGKEVQNRGSIRLAGIPHQEYIKSNRGKIGVIYRDEQFYSKMTVGAYLSFFAELSDKSVDVRRILEKAALLDSASTKINELSHGQRKRLALARERIKQPSLLLFQEPNSNMDRENLAILLDNMEELYHEGTTILNMSLFFRDTLLLGGRSYRLDDDGLIELQTGMEDASVREDQPAAFPAQETASIPVYRIEKIPARLEDRILLFDPMEIDFVESEAGSSALSVRGDRFPCALSMTELEERLRHFGFFRCHRSYLVNLQRLKEVVTFTRNSYSLSLDDRNKTSIPLSKGRLDELKEILKL